MNEEQQAVIDYIKMKISNVCDGLELPYFNEKGEQIGTLYIPANELLKKLVSIL